MTPSSLFTSYLLPTATSNFSSRNAGLSEIRTARDLLVAMRISKVVCTNLGHSCVLFFPLSIYICDGSASKHLPDMRPRRARFEGTCRSLLIQGSSRDAGRGEKEK
jgi:hypothetical protein